MQGYFLADNLNILKPNRLFEWATLSWEIPNCIPIGHISLVALGPSGCSFI